MTNKQMPEALRLAQAARSYAHVAPESSINPLIDHMASAFAEIERLRAENDALREDAERWRWLRDGERCPADIRDLDLYKAYEADLDTAIDAARKKG